MHQLLPLGIYFNGTLFTGSQMVKIHFRKRGLYDYEKMLDIAGKIVTK